MGGSSPSPFSAAFSTPAINALRYNTSQYGAVVPVLWGTHRVSINLIDQFGFTASGGGKGGKGGGGGGSSGGKKGGRQTYTVNVDFGLCEGPIAFTGANALANGGANIIWSNGGISQGLSAVDLNGYTGVQGQAADGVFSSSDPNQPVPGYSLTAHVTGTPMQLGQSPALPSIQFQICGFQRGTAGTSFPDDARPDALVSDLLTNASCGAGFPAGNVGDLSGFGLFCQSYGLAVSLLCQRQDTAARWLSEVIDACAAGAFFSGSQLKIAPFVSTGAANYGAAFTPNLTAAYSLSDDDFLDWEDPFGGRGSGARRDPIEITRKDPAEQPNWVSIEYQPAVYWYNTEVTGAFDQAAINAYGLRLKPSLPGHFFTNQTSANVSAQLQLQRGLNNLSQYRFRLNISKCLLEPMDIVEISETISGLSNYPVRVIAVEEDEENTIVVTAEDMFVYGGGVIVPLGAGGANNALQLDPTAAPGSTNPPVIFEPPPDLTNDTNEVWIVASGGTKWGGCEVWISLDGSTYGQFGTIYAGGRQGVSTADFPAGSDPDTTDTLALDLSESRGTLTSGTQADADQFVTLCWIGGELISYETATAGSPQYHYTLGAYLRRGAYGTAIADHPSGSQFARIDNTVFKLPFPPNLAPGQNFYAKFPAVNLFGNQLQDLSSCTAYEYTTTGAGTSPQQISVSGSYGGDPAAGALLQKYSFAEQATFPVNFAGSTGSLDAAPTNAVTFPIYKGASQIGTMNFAAGATTASFTLASATTFQSGGVIKIYAPSPQDATLSDPSWTLVATV